MSKINFNEAPQQEQKQDSATNEVKTKTMKPGIHKAMCTGVTESPEDIIGKPYITVGFINENQETLSQRFYMTDSARKWTILKIKNLVESTDQSIPEGDLTIEMINKLLVGKQMLLKVSGEEMISKTTGNKMMASVLENFKFSTSLASPGSLSYDEHKDIKRLEESASKGEGDKDGMPF